MGTTKKEFEEAMLLIENWAVFAGAPGDQTVETLKKAFRAIRGYKEYLEIGGATAEDIAMDVVRYLDQTTDVCTWGDEFKQQIKGAIMAITLRHIS